MMNLLKYRFRSVFRQKSIWITSLIGVVLFILGAKMLTSYGKITGFDECFKVDVIGIILIGIAMSLESTHNTTKNVISKGFSRISLLISNYIAVVAVILVNGIAKLMTLLVYYNNQNIPIQGLLPKVGTGIICCLAATFVYATISSIIGKTGFAIAIGVVVQVFGSAAIMYLGTLIKVGDIVKYWVDGMILLKTSTQIIVGIAYVALSVMLGCFIANKKEIK